MEQIGLLTIKETNGVASVSSVQRVHDLYRGVKVSDPTTLRLGAPGTVEREREREGEGKKDKKVSVMELYKMPKKMR